MSNARLRKAEAILSELRAKDAPALSNLIIYTDEADCQRQIAALREKGYEGLVIILPDNGRGPKVAGEERNSD